MDRIFVLPPKHKPNMSDKIYSMEEKQVKYKLGKNESTNTEF